MPPPAGLQFVAGTSGGVRTYLGTPSGVVDFTLNPTASPGNVYLATIDDWSTQEEVESGKVYVFGGPVSPHGVAMPYYTQGGLGDVTITISGKFDANSATSANTSYRLAVGAFIWVDLLYHAGSLFGHHNVYCKIVGGGSGAKMEGGQATFTRTLKVSGQWPLASYGTV